MTVDAKVVLIFNDMTTDSLRHLLDDFGIEERGDGTLDALREAARNAYLEGIVTAADVVYYAYGITEIESEVFV